MIGRVSGLNEALRPMNFSAPEVCEMRVKIRVDRAHRAQEGMAWACE